MAAGRGDRAALTQFIEATQRDVWRTIAYLSDPASAEDLTQETYLRAIKSLPRFSGRSTAKTWLLSIARRVVVDQIRYNSSRPRPAYVVDLDDVLSGGRIENMVEIRILLDGLEPERREALVLTQVLGMSYAEAAEVAGCPIGTIRSRVARAREDLVRATAEDDRTG
ncbi:MAG: sigma-70 family RNA polymerase sigma factor [Mycobacterium sp.]|nr:sigma-70 family RNA polymerase sigma factor [Mycobacterium sp.]